MADIAPLPPPDAGTEYPLCGHASPASILAWGPQGPIPVSRWLADVHALARKIAPECTHVLNICADRYLFLVGFGAGVLTGKISLQPSSLAPAALAHLMQAAPQSVCLHDGDAPALQNIAALLPTLDVRACAAPPEASATPADMPRIAASQLVAQVFTSGSTGSPLAHAKTWGKLCLNALAEAQRLQLARHGAPVTIIGTVPSQHMYGFESVMLLALVAGCSLWTGRPFYPADVAHALQGVPAPRMLVTTPVHLRALVDAGISYPATAQLLCATAPLAPALAARAEAVFAAPLHEIYGSTETSQLAVRRTVNGPAWQLFPNVVMEQQQDTTWVHGGHVEGRVALSDVIERVDDEHFVLLGRQSDMVNIAGRRSSLAYLNHQLAGVKGVTDGAFFLPQTAGDTPPEVERLCLIACAPGMTPRQVLDGLRPYVEPIFLPRPLILVHRLPRNDTGKLPLQALQAIHDTYVASRQASPASPPPDMPTQMLPSGDLTAQWQVPLTHPVFDGHFPGHPVVPGAMLLQQCLALWLPAAGATAPAIIRNAKFLSPCLPGDQLDFALTPRAAGAAGTQAASFRITRAGTVVASGVLERPCEAAHSA